MLAKDKNVLNNYNEAIQHEWLETNGLGGWSGSSIIGCNTRRYNGLLVAATVPPAERMNLVSKLDETIIINNERFELSTNNYGHVVSPKGYQYLSSFTKKLFPEWIYEVNGIQLRKTIAMVHGENTTLIVYKVEKGAQPFILALLPLIGARGYHSLQHAYNNIFWDVKFENGIFKNQPYYAAPNIYISIPGAAYKHAHDLLEKESLRREALLNGHGNNETVQQLILAADQFIVKRGEDLKTVIAGYHWFTDWGRDTMISLPGLCLSTGRYEDAKKIIAA